VRFGPLAFPALLLLLAAPIGEAHGSAITHVQPFTIGVPPKENASFSIEFEEGVLRADWVILFNAVARNNSVQLTLRDLTGIAAFWELPADENTHYLSGRIKRTEAHGLTLYNPGPNPANVTLYYDASCNCAGKPIPPDVPNGAVIFNVDVLERDIMRTEFPEPSALKLRVSHALRVNDTSQWPKDFRILKVSEAPNGEKNGKPAHVFDWTADRTGRFYFFVEAIAYDASKFDPSLGEIAMLAVYVEPSNAKVGTADAPAPSVVVAALAVLGVAFLTGGRRNR